MISVEEFLDEESQQSSLPDSIDSGFVTQDSNAVCITNSVMMCYVSTTGSFTTACTATNTAACTATAELIHTGLFCLNKA